jgi:hypothetical protein
MNWRRYFLALAATSILTLIVDVLLNAIVFRAVYKRAAAFLLPPNELNVRVPIGWTALLVIVAAFGFLLVRGRWLGLSRGLRFGLVLAVAGVAGVAGIGSIVAWPAELLFAIGVQQFVNGILLGAVFGVVYRETAAGSPR